MSAPGGILMAKLLMPDPIEPVASPTTGEALAEAGTVLVELVEAMRRQGLGVDSGMIARIEGRIYYGPEVTRLIAERAKQVSAAKRGLRGGRSSSDARR